MCCEYFGSPSSVWLAGDRLDRSKMSSPLIVHVRLMDSFGSELAGCEAVGGWDADADEAPGPLSHSYGWGGGEPGRGSSDPDPDERPHKVG